MNGDFLTDYLEEKLLNAAIKWWAIQRPKGMSGAEHVANPTAHLRDQNDYPPSDEEVELCRRIADYWEQLADEEALKERVG